MVNISSVCRLFNKSTELCRKYLHDRYIARQKWGNFTRQLLELETPGIPSVFDPSALYYYSRISLELNKINISKLLSNNGQIIRWRFRSFNFYIRIFSQKQIAGINGTKFYMYENINLNDKVAVNKVFKQAILAWKNSVLNVDHDESYLFV